MMKYIVLTGLCLFIFSCISPQTRDAIRENRRSLESLQMEQNKLQADLEAGIISFDLFNLKSSELNARISIAKEREQALRIKAEEEQKESIANLSEKTAFGLEGMSALFSIFFPYATPFLSLISKGLYGAAAAYRSKP